MTGYGYGQQQQSRAGRLMRKLEDLLFAPKVITPNGAGANLVEAVILHGEALDRNTAANNRVAAAIEEANRLRRRENGEE